MALKVTEWLEDDSDLETSYLFAADDPDDFDSEIEDGANAVWPSGGFSEEALPPAPGRCRRVPHDW